MLTFDSQRRQIPSYIVTSLPCRPGLFPAIRTIEVITLAYRAMAAMCYFEDGISLKRRTTEFRMRFKDALMCANAAGFGRTISQAGKPRAGRAVTSPDANSAMAFRIGNFCIRWRQDGALSLLVI